MLSISQKNNAICSIFSNNFISFVINIKIYELFLFLENSAWIVQHNKFRFIFFLLFFLFQFFLFLFFFHFFLLFFLFFLLSFLLYNRHIQLSSSFDFFSGTQDDRSKFFFFLFFNSSFEIVEIFFGSFADKLKSSWNVQIFSDTN